MPKRGDPNNMRYAMTTNQRNEVGQDWVNRAALSWYAFPKIPMDVSQP